MQFLGTLVTFPVPINRLAQWLPLRAVWTKNTPVAVDSSAGHGAAHTAIPSPQ